MRSSSAAFRGFFEVEQDVAQLVVAGDVGAVEGEGGPQLGLGLVAAPQVGEQVAKVVVERRVGRQPRDGGPAVGERFFGAAAPPGHLRQVATGDAVAVVEGEGGAQPRLGPDEVAFA